MASDLPKLSSDLTSMRTLWQAGTHTHVLIHTKTNTETHTNTHTYTHTHINNTHTIINNYNFNIFKMKQELGNKTNEISQEVEPKTRDLEK